MSAGQKLLIVGGITLAFWGMGYGLWYAVFAEHQALDNIGASLAASFTNAAQGHRAAADASLGAYREAKYVYDRQVDVHSHWIGLAMLLIVIGIGYDRVHLPRRVRRFAAAGLLLGAVVFPLGVLLQTLSHRSAPRILAIAGSVLVIAALAAIGLGVALESNS
jgi:hypothetical protein